VAVAAMGIEMPKPEKSPVAVPEVKPEIIPISMEKENMAQLIRQFDKYITDNYFVRDPYKSLIPRRVFS